MKSSDQAFSLFLERIGALFSLVSDEVCNGTEISLRALVVWAMGFGSDSRINADKHDARARELGDEVGSDPTPASMRISTWLQQPPG